MGTVASTPWFQPLDIRIEKTGKEWVYSMTPLKKELIGVFYKRVPFNCFAREKNQPVREKTHSFTEWVDWKLTNIFKDTKHAPPVVLNPQEAFLHNGTQLCEAFAHFQILSIHNQPAESSRQILSLIDAANGWLLTSAAAESKLSHLGDLNGLKQLKKIKRRIDWMINSHLMHMNRAAGKERVDGKPVPLDDSCWNVSGKSDPELNQMEFAYKKITEAAEKWRAQHWHDGKSKLSSRQVRQIKKISRYSAFASDHLIGPEKKENLDSFFEIAFLTHIPLKIFVQYPALIDLFKSSRMLHWFANGGKKVLRVNQTNELEIKVDRTWVPLKLDQQLCFKTGESKTLADIFEHFATKKDNELEYILMPEEGLTTMHYYRQTILGRCVSKVKYLRGESKDMPVYNILSKKEAMAQFGKTFDPNAVAHMVLAASMEIKVDGMGKKEKPRTAAEILREGSEVINVHGRYGTVVRLKEDQYLYLPEGAFPVDFPEDPGFLGANFLDFLGDTRESTTLYPDDNENRFKRHHAYIPYPLLTTEEFQDWLEVLEHIEAHVKTGNLPFSFGDKNCGYHEITAAEMLNRKREKRGNAPLEIPDIKAKVLEAKTSHAALGGLIMWINQLKSIPVLQNMLIYVVTHWLLRIQRSMKRLERTPEGEWILVEDSAKKGVFGRLEIYSPAKFFALANDPKWKGRIKIHTGIRYFREKENKQKA